MSTGHEDPQSIRYWAAENSEEVSRAPTGLTPEDIEEFKRIMKEECGVELSDQEAWDHATDLTGLYRMLQGPIPEDPEVTSGENSAAPGPSKQPVSSKVPRPRTAPRGQLSLGI